MENTRKPLVEKLREAFYNWCNNTSAHGISHAYHSQLRITRILWLLVFVGSFAYCTYTIIQTVIIYFQYETSITISRITELPASFPGVTFCNLNPFNEKLTSSILNNETDYYKCSTLNNNQSNQCYNDDYYYYKLKSTIANMNNADKTQYGYNLENDMLISCKFNDIHCNVMTDISKFWNNNYGNCYTFNSKVISEIGSNYGLKMEFVVKPLINDTKFDYKSGLYVIIHNQTDSPMTIMNNGINIPTGHETYIGIIRNVVEKLSSPYSDCLNELKLGKNVYANKLFGYFNDLNISNYDQEFCYKLCYQDRLLDKCGCLDLDTPKINNKAYCQKDQEINCMNNFKAIFSKSDLNELCESTCKQKCYTIEYKLSISSSTFPTINYLKFLQSDNSFKNKIPQNVTENELLEFANLGILKLIVNYDDLSYTDYSDIPTMTSEGFFGALGGQLGLFIGLSILGALELLELLLELVIISINHKFYKI